jgi:hypothetical protein
MDISEDTIPELQPVFAFLNSHSNKLYQEGYFLKLDDQDTRTYLPCNRCLIRLSFQFFQSVTVGQAAVTEPLLSICAR